MPAPVTTKRPPTSSGSWASWPRRASCAEAEADLAHELQDFSDHIRYGDAHKGVNIEIDRMAKVPEKLVEQYDRVAPPLLKISRRLQKQVHQVLQGPAARRAGDRPTHGAPPPDPARSTMPMVAIFTRTGCRRNCRNWLWRCWWTSPAR